MNRSVLNTGLNEAGRSGSHSAPRTRLIAVLALAALCGSVTASGVGMSNSWIDMSLTKARCIQQATLAVKKAGFTDNFEVAGESIFADQEDYSVLFRCVPDKRLAYVVVAGPDSDLADQYVSDVEQGFGAK
ncbi:hypothetical protein Q0M94_10480 [Deinococcus radiomollis]|uniref:hypothetical protein n=1 Tax=Deinococcus radiomollis TaxID=468916 RepID=UPI003891231E